MPEEIDLSEREREILRMVATGASNKEIAQNLVISANTVKVHLRNIFAKVGVTSRTEATLFAIRTGIAPPPREALVPANSEALPLVEIIQPASDLALPSKPRRTGWVFSALIVVLVISLLIYIAILRGIPAAGQLAATSTSLPEVTTLEQPERWGQLPHLPARLAGMAAASYEDALYLFSGEGSDGVSGLTWRFIPDQNLWEPLASKPLPVTDCTAILLGEEIYIPGGRSADGKPTRILEVYNPRNNTWDQKAPLPAARSGYAMAAFEGKLYLFGGWDGEHDTATVYRYDPALDTWEERTPLPTPRSFAAAGATTSKIYILGGMLDGALLDVNEVYLPNREDAGENPYQVAAPLPAPRARMGVASMADILYIIGGQLDPNVKTPAPALNFIPQTGAWNAFELPPAPIGSSPAVAPLNNYLYVLGGMVEGQFTDVTLAYHAIYTIDMPVFR